MKHRLGLLAGACWVVTIGCAREPVRPLNVAEVDSPAPAKSGEGRLTAGADGTLYLTWIESEGDGHALRFARWEASRWSEPGTIARGDHWFVNWADFPGMTAAANGTLFAHWLEKSGPDAYAYGVRMTRSTDGGMNWSEPDSPHRDTTRTEHGFVSWAPLADGRAALVWLDGRETAGGEPHGGGGEGHGDGGAGHGDGGRGAMTLRSAIVDAAGQLTDEALLDDRVCDCCNTDLVAGADGSLLAVYRDRSPEEVRDISVVRYDGGEWTPGRLIHADGWKIDGCPVNGPAMDRSGDRVVVAWYTAGQDDRSHVHVAFSEDGGRSFGEPVEFGEADPLGRVDVVFTSRGDRAWVLWFEAIAEGRAELRIRSVTPDREMGAPLTVSTTNGSRSSGFPSLARLGEVLFVAWTDPEDPPRVRTAILR